MDTLKRLDIQGQTEQTGETLRFVILVPHRDALKGAEAHSRRLFAAGFAGAYSFPHIAPVASVSRPLNRDELKALAKTIRDSTPTAGGKITGGKIACGNFTDGKIKISPNEKICAVKELSLLGFILDLPIDETMFPQTARRKLLSVFSPPVLCTAVIDSVDAEKFTAGEQTPEISFRSAFVANFAVRLLLSGDARYSFQWRMGSEVWLPKYRA